MLTVLKIIPRNNNMTSKQMRNDSLFVRNQFDKSGKWGIPIVHKQEPNLLNIELIACSDTRANDSMENRRKGVHFFVDDYRFQGIYTNPGRSFMRYSQYAFLLTPDYSTYCDMDLWRQLESVAKNRWVGAYWQSKGLTVIPTISWGDARSFEFCFEGVEQGSMVAVGMIGCKKAKTAFLRGYSAMLERIEPCCIICFGIPFAEMDGNIIPVDYQKSRKVVR